MKFGRADDLRAVDFSLPALDDEALAWLGATPRADDAGELDVRTGCPVWTSRSWDGGLLPVGVPANERLTAYARGLSAVELNATFYGLPSPDAIRRWRASVGAGFHFCPKFPAPVSRGLALGRVNRRAARAFAEAIAPLGSALGPAFLQLPPSAGRAVLVPLAELLADLRAYPLHVAVEVRSPALVHDGRLVPELTSLLREHGATSVITDTAGARDVLHSTLTTPYAFVRFAGHHPSPTDERRVTAWVDRVARWVDAGLRGLWFFVHQPVDERGAPELCRSLCRQLNERLGLSLPLWRTPGQLQLFAPG